MKLRHSSISLSMVVFLLCAVSVDTSLTSAETPGDWVHGNLQDVVDLYRHFHAHPELSFQEEGTAARLAQELRTLGAEVVTGIGGHGVAAFIRNGEGPTVMVRSDLDALPVTEKTGLVYSSQVRVKNEKGVEVGVMHACGHDVHITNLIAVARYLSKNKDLWKGTLMLIGQPAEERGAGAIAMLQDGLFERFPQPDYALALHVDATLAAGKVGFRTGYSLANVDSVDITVKGQGGHGAYPQTTIDPIVQAADLVMSLQTIVSREVKPLEPCVVTVGSIHGGTKHNIIGDTCHLQLTVRSYTDDVRQQLLDAIQKRARGIATAYGAPEPVVTISEGTPSLWNDPQLGNRMSQVFRRVLGKEHVTEAEQSMGGEDFSQYGRAGVPIMMFRLGAVDASRLKRYQQLGQNPPSLHSPNFYPDAGETLTTGIVVMSNALLELLKP